MGGLRLYLLVLHVVLHSRLRRKDLGRDRPSIPYRYAIDSIQGSGGTSADGAYYGVFGTQERSLVRMYVRGYFASHR